MISKIVKLAYPVIVSRFLSVILDVVSVLIVAQIGINTLAAYGIFIPIYLTISMIALSYLLVFSVNVERLQGNAQRLSVYIGSGVVFSLGLSALVIAAFCLVPLVLPYLGQSDFISKNAGSFFYYLSFGMPPLFVSSILNQALITSSHSKFVTIAALIQFILGVVFIYILSHTFYVELKGVAIGFDIAYWARCLITVHYFYKSKSQRIKIGNKVQLLEDAGFLFRVGWPVSVQYGGELLAGLVSSLMIGHLYAHALSAQQVANQLRILLLMIPYGFSQAISIVVAQHKVTDHDKRLFITKAVKKSLQCCFLLMLAILLIINFCSKWYVMVFISGADEPLIHLAQLFIIITSFVLLVDVIKYAVLGALRGLHKTKVSMLVSLAVYGCIGIPAAYLLGYSLNIGVVGIRLGMLLGLVISTIVLVVYYCRMIK